MRKTNFDPLIKFLFRVDQRFKYKWKLIKFLEESRLSSLSLSMLFLILNAIQKLTIKD